MLFLLCAACPWLDLGGVSALLFTGTYFSVSAAVGFIAVSGVAVQNGVILISHINHLRINEGLSVLNAAYQGAIDRMRPVLMTATVAMLGLAAGSNIKWHWCPKSKAICHCNYRWTAFGHCSYSDYSSSYLYSDQSKWLKKDRNMKAPCLVSMPDFLCFLLRLLRHVFSGLRFSIRA